MSFRSCEEVPKENGADWILPAEPLVGSIKKRTFLVEANKLTGR